MGHMTRLEGVEVLASSVQQKKVWQNTFPGTEKYELVVKVPKGSTALRALMQALEIVMTGSAVDGLRPSLVKAVQQQPNSQFQYETMLVQLCKATCMKTRCSHTERDPAIDGPQQGKLSAWASGVLQTGDFYLTMKSKNTPYILDEQGRPHTSELNWCIVNVDIDSWLRKRGDNPGVSHDIGSVQIVGRVDKPAYAPPQAPPAFTPPAYAPPQAPPAYAPPPQAAPAIDAQMAAFLAWQAAQAQAAPQPPAYAPQQAQQAQQATQAQQAQPAWQPAQPAAAPASQSPTTASQPSDGGW